MNYQNNPYANPVNEFKRFFTNGSTLSLLIIANVAVWVLIQIVKVFLFLYNQPDSTMAGSLLIHALAIPASLPILAAKPWTLLTYMFLHVEIWHLLFNMLWLYWFGKIFMEYLTSRQLFQVYLLGGISGGLIYVLAFNVFPVFLPVVDDSIALGASASVMAIVTAISFYAPNYTIQLLFFGRVKILYLAIVLFIFDFFMISSGNAGGHLAHIGGALFGLSYGLVFKHSKQKGYFRSNASFFNHFKNKFSGNTSHYNPGPGPYQRPFTDEQYNLKKKENQKRVDEILEKISKGGYDSLTKEEKNFLFNTSNKH